MSSITLQVKIEEERGVMRNKHTHTHKRIKHGRWQYK